MVEGSRGRARQRRPMSGERGMTACDWMPEEIQSYVIPESDPAFTATVGLHLTVRSVIAKGRAASIVHVLTERADVQRCGDCRPRDQSGLLSTGSLLGSARRATTQDGRAPSGAGTIASERAHSPDTPELTC